MTDSTQSECEALQQALGQAITAWASVEGALCQVFCLATTAKKREAAAAVFTAILSFEVQLAVTRAAMNAAYADKPELHTPWVTLAKRIDKLRPLRNKLAHGNIVVGYDRDKVAYVDFLPFHHFGSGKISDHYEHWSVADMNKLNDAFITASSDLLRLTMAMMGREQPPHISPAPNLQLGRPSPFQRLRSRMRSRP